MRRYRGSQLLAGGLCLILIFSAAWYFARSVIRSNRLNVVLVTFDTTRADRIGCYGYGSARTPAMDALAREGALFEFARTPYPLTLPAHASIMTGLNPPEHGLRINGRGRLNHEIPVLAEILRQANYETGAFIAAYVLNSKFGLNRGFETYDGDLTSSAHQHEISERQRDGKVVVDSAIGWLRQRSSRPFFCWIHLYDPHGPYEPRPKLFGDAFENQPYDAGIAYADLQLERLRDYLAKQKLSGQTLVIVVGDHGEGLTEHNETEHGYQLYDSTLHVPLIVAGPSVKAGIRVPTPVSLIDITPTILEFLNIPVRRPVTGRSLKPALSGEKLNAIPIYAESELALTESRCAPLRSVTTGRWKYIETTQAELYDLSVDPHEVQNLAGTKPDQVRELTNILEELSEKMTPASAESVSLTAGEKQILASLGYVAGVGPTKPPAAGERLPDVKELLPLQQQLELARERSRRGDLTAATEMLHKILNELPGYSTARLMLGDLLLREGTFQSAADEYALVLKDQPQHPEANASRGNALAAQGLLEDAAVHYSRAVEFEPSNASYHYYFAFTLARQGKVENAIDELKLAVSVDPAFVDARMPLSKLLADTGRIDESIQQYEAILKYRPETPPPEWIPKGRKRK